MNKIRQIQELNKRELEAGISTNASWHTDYRDTAYIYIGGLPFELSEGDILTIFSQYGEPTYINLVRDKETGKSRGFAFLKYEDQRSTDLAVDNLSGMVITGRTISVDHTRYKTRDDGEDPGIDLTKEAEDEEDGERRKRRKVSGDSDTDVEEVVKPRRALIKEELELEALRRDHDEDDPMKEYLIKEKEEEVSMALARLDKRDEKKRDKSGHKSRHRHRSKREDDSHEHRSSRRDRSMDDHKEKARRRSRSIDEQERKVKRRDRSTEASDVRIDRRPRRTSREREPRRHRSVEEKPDNDGRSRRTDERRREYPDDRDDDRPRKSRHRGYDS